MSNTDFEMQRLEGLWSEYQALVVKNHKLSIEDFADDHPEDANSILEFFPTLRELHLFANEFGTLPDCQEDHWIDDFQVLRRIGSGGMGVVYAASSERFRQTVALKVIGKAHATPTLLERFAREASAASQLHHSNIVPVYEFCSDGDEHYFTMRYIEGCNLADVVNWNSTRRQRVPESERSEVLEAAYGRIHDNWAEIAKIGCQVTRALAHAHHHGVLHRDIKPGNLLYDGAGKTWVTDFGIAKLEDAPDVTTMNAVGTPRYMPPEQMRGTADHRSDLFAVGLTLYELATMQRIGSPACKTSESGGLAPLSSVDSEIPSELARIIHKSINLDPKRRYQNAADFADDLSRFQRKYDREHSKRRLMLAATGILAVFAVFVLLVFFRPAPQLPANLWIAKQSGEIFVNENDSFIGYVDHAASNNPHYRYRVKGGADSKFFHLDSEDGRLEYIDPPDFEDPKDANGDNEYEVTFEVFTSNSERTEFPTTIRVQDVQEAPRFGANPITASVRRPYDVLDGVIHVEDDVDARFDGLRFQISGGPNADRFAVMPLYGVPVFRFPGRDYARYDEDDDNVLEFDLTVSDRTFAKNFTIERDNIRFGQVVPGSRFIENLNSETVHSRERTLGVASADGKLFYELRDDNDGTASLWLLKRNSHPTGVPSIVESKLINPDCGIESTALGFATADAMTFYVLSKNDGNYASLSKATLDSNGRFDISVMNESCGVSNATASFGTLDGRTFYHRFIESDAQESEDPPQTGNDRKTSFWVGVLSESGTLENTQISGFGYAKLLQGEAYWFDQAADSKQSTVRYRVKFRQ